MIISASRRTDIPAFYLDWFLERLRRGEALVRNPLNPHRVSRVLLDPGHVDCIVFWTKNPLPLLARLDALRDYPHYVQFTVTPYARDLEPGLPDKEALLDAFRSLSVVLGPERVVWRYSPVIVNERYPESLHLDFFGGLAKRLGGYTRKCNLGFLDVYAKIRTSMRRLGIGDVPDAVKNRMARVFHAMAGDAGIALGACGNLDLDAAGVPPARCVDAELVNRLTGGALAHRKDGGQRDDCYCALSADIGAYDTCPHACAYCYANRAGASVRRKCAVYDPFSPMLCDAPGPDDVVTLRREAKRKNDAGPTLF